jgi:hypothetical protein
MSPDPERRADRLGALILLSRAREEAQRRDMATTSQAETRAREAEAELDARRRTAGERISQLRDEAPGEQPPAQVLQFRSRAERTLREVQVQLQALLAAMRGERITAAEASARAKVALAAARREREHLEERLAKLRRERRRRREEAEE